jgi:ribonuclease HIII
MAETFVTSIPKSLVERFKKDLDDQGFVLTKPPHTLFQAKKPGVSCTLYASLKLTVQGKNMKEFIEFYLEPEILKEPIYTYAKELTLSKTDLRPHIGVDEAGKGDYFGPLCVAGVFADEKTIPLLIGLGVRDSKKLSDPQISKIAKEIVKIVPNYIVRLWPEKYNELYASFKNLNSLLAWCHATVIENIHLHCQSPLAIIDKFAHERVVESALAKKGVSITLEQRIRGEEDVVVAAASILARWAFVEGLATTEKRIQETLPKGASQAVVNTAKKLVRTHGPEILYKAAKVHFKISQEASKT